MAPHRNRVDLVPTGRALRALGFVLPDEVDDDEPIRLVDVAGVATPPQVARRRRAR